MHPAWVERFLERLSLKVEPPTLDYLTRLVGAHLSTLPFENITKFYYYRRYPETGWFLPPIGESVADLYRLHAGGTCFTANSRFHNLLAALGFDLHYVACWPPMHMGSVVRLPEGRFYVDVGGGGPLFRPVDLAHGSRQELNGAGTEISPIADQPGIFRFAHLLHGESRLEWRLHAEEPLRFTDFADAIARANQPGARFMTMLRCQLIQPERQRTLSLLNHRLTIRQADGSETERSLMSPEALEEACAEEFGLPNLPVREAVETLASLGIDIFAQEG